MWNNEVENHYKVSSVPTVIHTYITATEFRFWTNRLGGG